MSELVFVSVMIPVFNEERFIGRCLGEVLAQDYPADRFEVLVADGMSTDRTREIVQAVQAAHPNVRLIDNPKRIVSSGLNRALTEARGAIVVRLDGHCEYPRDYIRRVVELRENLGSDSVGGVLEPVGSGYVQRAIASAYSSPLGLASSALKATRAADTVREVDAVHGGCWKWERLVQIGGFDEEMVRNQDDELSFRLRQHGGLIFQSLAIRVRYHVRNSFKNLLLQFLQYGYWKVRVVRKHPRQASVRHFVPAAFVLAVGSGLMTTLFWREAWWGAGLLVGGYLAAVGTAAMSHLWTGEKKLWPGIVVAVVVMHVGYGIGFLLCCVTGSQGKRPVRGMFKRSSRVN